ncbi:hypothetical protein DS487_16955 [Salmonella enterica subsp. enterica]|nr:hypothetical protein [Salmonella enterica subsp. enterica serovar Hvittingfoss]
MSMTVIPFDETLPVRYRNLVMHYLHGRTQGAGDGDVFSPEPYLLPPVFSPGLLDGFRQTGDAMQRTPFRPVMVEVTADVKKILDSDLFFLIFGPQVLYVSAGMAPGQTEKYRALLQLRFPAPPEDSDDGAGDSPEAVASESVHRHLAQWCAFQTAAMCKKSANLARGRLLSQVLKWQQQRQDFPETAWGAMMQQMLDPEDRVPQALLSRVVPELMRLYRDGLRRVTDGERGMFLACSMKTLHDYPLLRVLTNGILAENRRSLMPYRSGWLIAGTAWLRDLIRTIPAAELIPVAAAEASRLQADTVFTGVPEIEATALLALAFDDFHALVHASAYEDAASLPDGIRVVGGGK